MTVLKNVARLAAQFGIAVILQTVHQVGLIDAVPVDLPVGLIASPPFGHTLHLLHLCQI